MSSGSGAGLRGQNNKPSLLVESWQKPITTHRRQKLVMSRKYVSYATFKERQFSYVGKLKRHQHYFQCWHITLGRKLFDLFIKNELLHRPSGVIVMKNIKTDKIKVNNFLHSVLLFMTAIATVLYLRLSLDTRPPSPYPPKRKMAGILSYELGRQIDCLI